MENFTDDARRVRDAGADTVLQIGRLAPLVAARKTPDPIPADEKGAAG